jgi:hypothetical protein
MHSSPTPASRLKIFFGGLLLTAIVTVVLIIGVVLGSLIAAVMGILFVAAVALLIVRAVLRGVRAPDNRRA